MTERAYALFRAPREVLFGCGALTELGRVASGFGRRPVVLLDPWLPPAVRAGIEVALTEVGLEPSCFSEVEGSSTIEVAERTTSFARAMRADLVIAVGGGSVLDLGKHVALLLSWPGDLATYYGERRVPGPCLPLVSVPTTAGTGSEVSPVAVVSDPNLPAKAVVSSPWNIPSAAISDPLLTLSCPPRLTAHAGMDAFVNGLESFLAPVRAGTAGALTSQVFIGNSMLSRPHAHEAIRLIGRHLVRAVDDGADLEAREAVALGSLQAALGYSQSGTGLIHALDYPVEALAHVPHGLGVGLLLPYVLAFDATSLPAEVAAVGVAVGVAEPADDPVAAAVATVAWTIEFKDRVGIPRSLADIGVERRDLPALARDALTVTRLIRNSPRPADLAALELILDAAWHGETDMVSRAPDVVAQALPAPQPSRN